MQRYEPQGFRPIFGLAAVALTALTIGALVVGPAGLPAGDHVGILAGGTSATPGAREVAISPSQVEVVVERDSALAVAGAPNAMAKRGHRG